MLAWLKKTLLFLLFIALIIILIIGNLFLTLTLSLSYNNLKNNFKESIIENSIEGKVSDSQIEKFYDAGTSLCKSGLQSNFGIHIAEFQRNYQFMELKLSCPEVLNSTQDNIIERAVEKSIFTYYYSNNSFNCNFVL